MYQIVSCVYHIVSADTLYLVCIDHCIETLDPRVSCIGVDTGVYASITSIEYVSMRIDDTPDDTYPIQTMIEKSVVSDRKVSLSPRELRFNSEPHQ